MKKIRELLEKENVDALFITRFSDIRYVTGFKTLSPEEREAFVLVTGKNIYVFSDGRYAPAHESSNYTFILLKPGKGLTTYLQEILGEEKIRRLGFEKEDLKWSEYDILQKSLTAELVPMDRTILFVRAIKKEEEIENIRKACEIGDLCLAHISKSIRPGVLEKDIAWGMEKWIRGKGYEMAFDPIVAVDENAAVPHYNTKEGRGIVKADSVVLIDFGVRYRGYNSDITRMFFTGKQSGEIVKAYEVLLDAQLKTIEFAAESVKCSDIDTYCRSLLESGGLENYPHSTGHGIGLEVHEYPKLSTVSKDILTKGNAFTIEPGVYVQNRWGMRIEDTICINSRGKVEVLTGYPKSMKVL